MDGIVGHAAIGIGHRVRSVKLVRSASGAPHSRRFCVHFYTVCLVCVLIVIYAFIRYRIVSSTSFIDHGPDIPPRPRRPITPAPCEGDSDPQPVLEDLAAATCICLKVANAPSGPLLITNQLEKPALCRISSCRAQRSSRSEIFSGMAWYMMIEERCDLNARRCDFAVVPTSFVRIVRT